MYKKRKKEMTSMYLFCDQIKKLQKITGNASKKTRELIDEFLENSKHEK